MSATHGISLPASDLEPCKYRQYMYYICGYRQEVLVPQLHLYVPDETAELLKSKARERGISVSGYLAELVGREMPGGGWPDGFFEEVLGGWAGELERIPAG